MHAYRIRFGVTAMNADQEHNIREAVRVIGETLFRAWSYLHVMRGLQRGARANTQRVEKHALALDVIYRALFDALFASVGTVLDRTRSTYSLPNLINMITRYGIADAELRRELRSEEHTSELQSLMRISYAVF